MAELSAPGSGPPRGFLSHSSLDKDRFVRRFAEALRSRGVDVWYDEWELLPGDSLVDKIFEEGLGQAEVFLLVISSNSVESSWVREELNAAVVKKIEQHCKIIPIVIDDCEVPAVLQHTVWQRIENLDDYSTELDRIVRAIFESRSKPSLAKPPGYSEIQPIEGLQQIDTRILEQAGKITLANDGDLVDSKDLLEMLAHDEITEDAFLESLEILEGNGFVKVVKTFAAGIEGMSAFSITTRARICTPNISFLTTCRFKWRSLLT